MKSDDLTLLRALHHDKMVMYLRHIAVARLVSDYEFNNAYQYVINREDTHLTWLEAAIIEFGGAPDTVDAPQVTAAAGKKNDRFLPLVVEDARQAQQFVATWKPRAVDIRSDRHRKLVGVIIGETAEQNRFFDQVVAGQDELLGRRMAGASTGDGVMSVRWIE